MRKIVSALFDKQEAATSDNPRACRGRSGCRPILKACDARSSQLVKSSASRKNPPSKSFSMVSMSPWVAEFTTSGATVNPAIVSGLGNPRGIAVSPSVTPEPSTLVLLGAATVALFGYAWRRAVKTSWQASRVRPVARRRPGHRVMPVKFVASSECDTLGGLSAGKSDGDHAAHGALVAFQITGSQPRWPPRLRCAPRRSSGSRG